MKILVPVDGSETAVRGVSHAIAMARMVREPLEIDLLNVQAPVTFGGIKKHVSREALEAYYQEEGEKAGRTARELLEEAGVPFRLHVLAGQPAETIAQFARDNGSHQVVMGTRGLGVLTGLLLGSVATKIAALVEVPVTLVK
jgi:nucleotide-binding universal stress UspA family protein